MKPQKPKCALAEKSEQARDSVSWRPDCKEKWEPRVQLWEGKKGKEVDQGQWKDQGVVPVSKSTLDSIQAFSELW